MHPDLSGFHGAPVTYAMFVGIAATSAAAFFTLPGRNLLTDCELITRNHQYWRLFTGQFTFNHGIAASFGLYLLYQFRVLERQMGSYKFGSSAFCIMNLSSFYMFCLCQLWSKNARNFDTSGGYMLFGYLLYYYHRFIPRLQPNAYTFFNVNLSDKSLTYIMMLMMLGRDVRTLILFVPGWYLGLLWSTTRVGDIRLPWIITSFFRLFRPLFSVVPASAASAQRQRRAMEAQQRLFGQRGAPAQGQPHPEGRANASQSAQGQGYRDQLLPGGPPDGMLAPHLAARPPSQEAIQQLMALGFDRDRSLRALQITENNVQAAANRLLNAFSNEKTIPNSSEIHNPTRRRRTTASHLQHSPSNTHSSNTVDKIKIRTKRRNLLKLTPIEAIDLTPAENGRVRNVYCTLVLLDSELREIRGEKHRTPPLRQATPVWSPLKATMVRSGESGVESYQPIGIGAAAVAEEYTFGTIVNIRKAKYLLIKCKDKGRMETDDLGRLLLSLDDILSGPDIENERIAWYDLQLGHGGKLKQVQGKVRIATRTVREPSLHQLWACAEQLRNEVPSRDRSLYLKPHPCVITGKEATEWMLCHGPKRPMDGGISCSTEEEAILLGSCLLRRGILVHTTGSGDASRFINSGWRYYRFAVHHLDPNKQRDANKLKTLILSGKAEEEDEEAEDSISTVAAGLHVPADESKKSVHSQSSISHKAPGTTSTKAKQTLAKSTGSKSSRSGSTGITAVRKASSEGDRTRTASNAGRGKSKSKLQIENFELLKVLGTGSFGRVLSARGPDGKVYAIKIISKIGLENAHRQNAKIERDILKQVDHPFVASLQFAFQNEDKLYLGMEFFNGGDLRHHLTSQAVPPAVPGMINTSQRFTESRIQLYAAELVAGLAHLHSMEIIYRDLKPENIIIAKDGHIVLVDFGLSKFDSKQIKAHSLAGSPEYIAPEVLSVAKSPSSETKAEEPNQSGYDKTCDWWSLGILIFEMFVGRTPFKDENTAIMYRNIREGQLFLPPSLPETARSLLIGLLERDASRRLGANETVPFSIMKHPFFQTIDWDALQRKEIEPEWIPDVVDDADAKYIDNEFINQIPVDTPEWRMLDSVDREREYLPDFTFQPKQII
uniref:Protein kinase putative n=1 Tax=Albugo laibachii Nc14 TaxID=890382 RepID=F0WJV0_9STRA|nr:protein kinase putative [Albugo laibachii Nc14]|eukprot:CCA21552.1 protein kinase putative [Albugo laibachii Nc14]